MVSKEELFLRITEIVFDNNDAVIGVQATNDIEDDYGTWIIKAVGLLAHEITDLAGPFELLRSGHVLVRELIERRHSLYINGSVDRPAEVVGRLFSAHTTIVADWIPFGRYLNECCQPERVLEGGHGLIAAGPEFLIDCYDKTLRGCGIGTSRPPSHPAKVWDGTNWQEVPASVNGFLVGSSYFLATNLEETKKG